MRRPDPLAAARRAARTALRTAGTVTARAAAARAARRGEADHDDLRAPADPRGLRRGPALALRFDGRAVPAYAGETVAAALLAAGIRTLRETRFAAAPRGVLCGIGACHDCLVTVDGAGPVRACLTPVTDGMRVATHRPGGPGFDPGAIDLRGLAAGDGVGGAGDDPDDGGAR